MIRSKARFRRRRIAGVAWFGGVMCLLFAYWLVMSNYVIGDFWDASYVQKFERLKACVRENPRRPLCVMFGSSRVEFGLRPAVLEQDARDKNTPEIFNFGMGGAGLFREFIYLRRVIEAGVKPQRVGIEIYNLDMTHPFIPPPDTPELQVRARKDELDDYAGFSVNPSAFLKNWKLSRWNPAYAYGMRMPGQTLTLRLVPLPWIWRLQKNPYDKWGWLSTQPVVDHDISVANFALAMERFRGAFENYKIEPKNDRVLRRMLEMCKSAGIQAFLVRMPENGDVRTLRETALVDDTLESYLGKIHAECQVPVIDASLWIAKEKFSDAYHLNLDGGAEFTRRLAVELAGMQR